MSTNLYFILLFTSMLHINSGNFIGPSLRGGNSQMKLHMDHQRVVRDAPDSIDWRKKGGVTLVTDQGSCRADWAFAVTGAIEGHVFSQTGKLIGLSKQNLIDCTQHMGCSFGYPDLAMKYVVENSIASEAAYPYQEKVGQCRSNQTVHAVSCSEVVRVSQGNEGALKNAVANFGPVVVTMCVTDNFLNFTGEDVYEENCPLVCRTRDLLIVGYGTTSSGKDYWILKNSLGEKWADHGYIKVLRNRNICGIADLAVHPDSCKILT